MTIRPAGDGWTDRYDEFPFQFSAIIYRIAQKKS